MPKTRWPAAKAGRVFAALLRIGWQLKRTVNRPSGSHRVLEREGFPNYVFAFHDGEEIGPPMMGRIGKKTGLTPEDL
ncbi:MAG: type II toxin-antitoxin system HicA family toxin, partial [Anaerolineales bacterium]